MLDPSPFPFSIQLQSNQPSIKPSAPPPYFFLFEEARSSPPRIYFQTFNWIKERIKRERENSEPHIKQSDRERERRRSRYNELVAHCCLRVSRGHISGWKEA